MKLISFFLAAVLNHSCISAGCSGSRAIIDGLIHPSIDYLDSVGCFFLFFTLFFFSWRNSINVRKVCIEV